MATASMDWMERDLYAVLEVAQSATDKEIKGAYRRLARQHHPDANPDDPQAEEKFKEISAAYDVVGDATKRRKYDELRRLATIPRARARRRGGDDIDDPYPGGGFSGSGGFSYDVTDLFGDMFDGRGRSRATRAGAGGAPAPGGDLHAQLHLDLREVAFGVSRQVEIAGRVICSTCAGSGARPGTAASTCRSCQGRGQVLRSEGRVALIQTCPTCHGRGQITSTPCEDCTGIGTHTRPRKVKVRIPPGVQDGQVLRLSGRGDPGRDGGPAGDLFLTVRVTPHPLFGRDGSNLTLRVPISYPEAVLGAEVKIPTLDGTPVTVRIPPGPPSGRTLRVTGRGIPDGSGRPGDLLLTVEVDVPQRISATERKAVEALAKAMNGHANPRTHLGV